MRGGFIGVDVFFVLSGYLIGGLLHQELTCTGKINLLRFYTRRLRRLFPALLTMLVVTSVLALVFLSRTEASVQLASAPYAVTWTSNIYFTYARFDYFNDLAARDLFLHTWSLGVEEQFYLLWPLLLLFLAAAVKHLKKSEHDKSASFLIYLLPILAGSLALSLYWTYNKPLAAYYLTPARIWQFTSGTIVYLLSTQSRARGIFSYFIRHKKSSAICLWLGLFLILAGVVGMKPNSTYPGWWAIVPTLGASLLILSVNAEQKLKLNPLTHPVLLWIGDRSYSIYLWHWPILIIAFAHGYEGQTLTILALISLTLVISHISYHFIELPFWKGRWSRALPRVVLLNGLFVMSLALLIAYHGLHFLPKIYSKTELVEKWKNDMPIIYHMSCDDWIYSSDYRPCFIGNKKSNKTVVVLGDSIGSQWFSFIPVLYPEKSWRIIDLTKSSCPIIDEDTSFASALQNYPNCVAWRTKVLNNLQKVKPDVVIFGSASTYDFSKKQWIEGTSRILGRISKDAKEVIIIAGTPALGFDGPGCLSWHTDKNATLDLTACVSRRKNIRAKNVANYLLQSTSEFKNVHLLDLNDLVCPDNICNAASPDGIVVFRDNQHITDSFVRSRTPEIIRRISSLLINNHHQRSTR